MVQKGFLEQVTELLTTNERIEPDLLQCFVTNLLELLLYLPIASIRNLYSNRVHELKDQSIAFAGGEAMSNDTKIL